MRRLVEIKKNKRKRKRKMYQKRESWIKEPITPEREFSESDRERERSDP